MRIKTHIKELRARYDLTQEDLAKRVGVELNDRGEIKINRKSETNIPGVYAAGDRWSQYGRGM